MLLPIALMAQEIAGPPCDTPGAARPALTRQRCTTRKDDILVCGRVDSQRRGPLPDPENQRVFGPAATRIASNMTLSAEAEEGDSPFAEGPRAMVRFTLDF